MRLLKHQLKVMLQTIHDGDSAFNGIVMKYGNLVTQACLARNSSVTYGGVTPLALAFGRRPRDVLTPENSEPNQLTGNPTDTEVTARAVRELTRKPIKRHANQMISEEILHRDFQCQKVPSCLAIRCTTGL